MNERYARHSLIDWFDQDLVASRHVLLIGAGAIGNEVLKNLVLLGVGSIHVVDFDDVEIHNLTRSVLLREKDVGTPKAFAVAEAAKLLDGNCRITAERGAVWDCVSFDQVRQADVVFCCVDNVEARIQINQLCSLLGTDLINAGIDSRYVSAELFPFRSGEHSACYECQLPPTAYQRLAERYSCGWLRKVAFEEKKIPTTVITASYAGALATSLFLNSYRSDVVPASRRVFLDTLTSATSRQELHRSTDCPCCGARSAQRVVLKTSRKIGSILDLAADEGLALTSSEPILVEWSTPNCDACSQSPPMIVFRSARDFNEASTVCGTCGLVQRLPVVKDQFTLRELRSRFAGMSFPGKFVTWKSEGIQFVVELVESRDD